MNNVITITEKKHEAPVEPRPSDIDALLTANDAHQLQHPQGLTPTTPQAANAIVDGMQSAIHALHNDEPVTAHIEDNTGFVHRAMPEEHATLISEELKQLQKEVTAKQFADHTGRNHEDMPTYSDGTAYLLPNVLDFYDTRVAHLPAKSGDIMPDALFRIGEVSDQVAAGLHEVLPGFNDNLREARITMSGYVVSLCAGHVKVMARV